MGKNIYLIAAVITTLVFVIIFFMVKMDENSKINELSGQIQELYEEQQANKILSRYFDKTDSNSCAIYEKQVSKQLTRIYTLFSQLEKIKDTTFTISDNGIKRQYLITSMSLWLDLRDSAKYCNLNIKPLLLFLPDEKNCVKCDAMIEQLEVLKQDCENVRVFAFPSKSEEFEFVTLLEKDYNVSSFPAIVANNNVYYEIVDNEKIKKDINCS